MKVEYTIKNSHLKRRTAIFGRKLGGSSKSSQVQSDSTRKMDIVSIHPQTQNRTYINPSPPNKKYSTKSVKHSSSLLRPRSAPSAPDFHGVRENRVRVRSEVKLPTTPCPWDNSTYLLDRDFLQLQLDSKLSAYRQSEWSHILHPDCFHSNLGGSHEMDRKTLMSSYSRCRTSKTSGPVVNIHSHRFGYSGAVEKKINDIESTGIHDKRWNIATKDKDDDERAKPTKSFDKSAKHLFAEFHSMERRSKKVSGTIIESHALIQDQDWDTCKQSFANLSRPSVKQSNLSKDII